MYLFFDTETTRIPRNFQAPASDLQNWPRLVQIAWLLIDDQAREVRTAEYIIKPMGFVIPGEAARIHGIPTEVATQKGVDLQPVLTEIAQDLAKATVLVAHTLAFDEKILGAEFLRSNSPDPLGSLEHRCTMQGATNLLPFAGPSRVQMAHAARASPAAFPRALRRCAWGACGCPRLRKVLLRAQAAGSHGLIPRRGPFSVSSLSRHRGLRVVS